MSEITRALIARVGVDLAKGLGVALPSSTVVILLPAALAVLRVTTLVPNNQDAQAEVVVTVDDGVREVGQRVHSPTVCGRCSNARMLLKQLHDAFELNEESPGQSGSCFGLVEPDRLCEVLRREAVDGSIH